MDTICTYTYMQAMILLHQKPYSYFAFAAGGTRRDLRILIELSVILFVRLSWMLCVCFANLAKSISEEFGWRQTCKGWSLIYTSLVYSANKVCLIMKLGNATFTWSNCVFDSFLYYWFINISC